MDANEMEKLCRHLDEFALPRAIVNFAQEHFVAWNKTFLARTGYSEEDIRVLKPGDIIVEAASGFVLNNAETAQGLSSTQLRSERLTTKRHFPVTW
jgi:hypothetical protein